ncbi:MAG: flagellar filament capping protein FliD [Deltaproteobacteria bacterium]|nr:flagellar filament capping protein FliD [Deltaproteobacteria bacterium]
MSTISFSGLASGLDTESIISSLMEIEQAPVTALEEDQEYLETKLEAYTSFDTYLDALNSAVKALDSTSELNAYSATLSSDEISTSVSSIAKEGSYNIEVVSLACQQKDIADEGFGDTTTADLSGSITIGEETLEYENVSLSDLVETINSGEYGISASLINDGTEDGYRLILTADQSGSEIDIVATGSITLDTVTDGHTREGSQAHIVVDNIDIYSNSNSIDTAVNGVTLELLDTTEGDTITLNVSTDSDAVVEKVESFVTAYNDVIAYIADQSASDWGSDSEFRSVKRKLQNFISTQIGVEGSFSSLTELGLETDYETGQLTLDTEILSDAIEEDFESFQSLFLGDDDTDGIAVRMADYMAEITDSDTGILAVKEDSTEDNIDRIEEQIERLELRLEKRQENLEAQFTALETLLSELNTTSDYLANWIDSLSDE